MSKRITSISTVLVLAILFIYSPSATAQSPRTVVTDSGKVESPETPHLSRTSKTALIAVNRAGRLQLAGDRERFMAAMQKALYNRKEPGVVTDISILSFPKISYLAVRIERQGSLYLPIDPSNGGIQGIFAVNDLNSLYCSGGCSACSLVPSSISQGTGPTCACAEENQSPLSDCKLYPKRNVLQLAQQFNGELLAAGFEVTDGTSATDPAVTTSGSSEAKPGRVDPIKRPKN